MAKRYGASSPIKKGVLVQNRMNIRSVNVMFVARADVQHGEIPVRNAAQRLLINPQKFRSFLFQWGFTG
jgi:phage antirepressor YoqD-like protein